MSLVTQDHIDAYRRDGCVHIPGVFSTDWVQRLDTEIMALIARARSEQTLGPQVAPQRVQNDADWADNKGGFILRNAAPHSRAMQDWLVDSPAGAVCAEVIGAERIHFWVDASFLKEGEDPGAATPWHNDVCTFGFYGQHMPSFWMALTDVGMDNAPLVTLRGSHTVPHRFRSTFSPRDLPLPEGYVEWEELLRMVEEAPDEDKQVWPVKAGDCLIIHPDTIHASLARKPGTAGRRLAFTVRFLGSDPVWHPNPLTVKIPRAEESGLLVEGGGPPPSLFPVIWPPEERTLANAA